MGYRLARLFVIVLIRLLTRIDFQGLENVPPTGSYLIVSNHLGRLDAPMVYYVLDRRDVVMMVAEKYRKVALFRWLVKQLDGMWVDRFNADLGAMRAALKRLKEGAVLVMAPEGTRSQTQALQEGRAGAGYLAAKSGVPVLPVAIAGSEDKRVWAQLRRLRRARIQVQVGEPFRLPPLRGQDREAEVQQAIDEIMCRIGVLLPPQYRGVYQDHPRLLELERNGAAPGPEKSPA